MFTGEGKNKIKIKIKDEKFCGYILNDLSVTGSE